MTIEEALQELRLSTVGTKDEIRRAYLRAVRRANPEQDPVGFMRVRTAFDLLRDSAPSPPREPVHVVREEEAATESPPAADAVDHFFEKPQPVEVSSSELSHEDVGYIVERIALRPGNDFPVDAFADARSRNDLSLAAKLLHDYLAQAGPDDEPPIDDALEVMLRLHETGRIAVAPPIFEPLAAWLSSHGAERRVMADRIVQWSQVRDLESVRSAVQLPARVRTILARLARDEDEEGARIALREFRELYPKLAASAASTIASTMPAFRSFAVDVRPVESVPDAGWSPGLHVFVIATLLGLIGWMLFLTEKNDHPSTPVPVEPLDAETQQLIDQARERHLEQASKLVAIAAYAARESRCETVDQALASLPAVVAEASPDARALQPQFLAFVGRVSRKCPAPLPRFSAPSVWPFDGGSP